MNGKSLGLKDKLAVITGGSSGVGLECARQLVAAGARVIVVGSNQSKLDAATTELGDSALSVPGDVRDSEFADAIFEFAATEIEQSVDILINSAGTILRENAAKTSDQDWDTVMETNVNGVFYFSRAFANQETQNGAIVNVSSTCGQVGAAGLAAYCASKGAVDQLTRSMALELAEQNITVNAVAPGAINSPMLYSKHGADVSEDLVTKRNLESIPIGALAEPEEVARAIIFLASERHITGTILTVDGGYTAA